MCNNHIQITSTARGNIEQLIIYVELNIVYG